MSVLTSRGCVWKLAEIAFASETSPRFVHESFADAEIKQALASSLSPEDDCIPGIHDISKKKKHGAEVIFRLSRPVSYKNQENGSGKQ